MKITPILLIVVQKITTKASFQKLPEHNIRIIDVLVMVMVMVMVMVVKTIGSGASLEVGALGEDIRLTTPPHLC